MIYEAILVTYEFYMRSKSSIGVILKSENNSEILKYIKRYTQRI